MTIGCDAPPVSDKQQGDVFGQLNSIQSCYLQYSMQYNKAPASPDDLAPLLEQAGLTGPDVLSFLERWHRLCDFLGSEA